MRLASLFAVVAVLGASNAPRAQADEPDAAGRVHFETGRAKFDDGEYDLAVQEFLTAYSLAPYPGLLINIAQCYERIYKTDRARDYYERFLREAPPKSDLRLLADKRLRVLRQLPGSILVDAGKDGAQIELSGDPIVSSGKFPDAFGTLLRTSGKAFEGVPPGDYHVHVTLADYIPIDENIHLTPGETHALNVRLVHQSEQLTIFSIPDGARVFIDDREEGTTPFSRTIETGRAHRLRLETADYPTYRESFDLVAGRPLFRRIQMPRPHRSGRTEMVIGAMAFGGFAATGLSVAIGGTRVTTGTGLAIPVLTSIAGVGVGFLGAWALTDDSMKVGHSSMIVGSTVWGTTLGTSLALGLGLTSIDNQRQTQQYTLSLAILGGGLGMGAGMLASWLVDPSAGDSALFNSGGLWGTVGGALLTESISFRHADHDPAFGLITLGTTTLGLATGAIMARYFELSRAHVAIIDAAGLFGSLLGYGIGYAAGNDAGDPGSGTICLGSVNRCVSAARYALGGMVVGLVAAALLTRRYKADLPKLEAMLTRHHDSWSLGLPSFQVNTVRVPEGIDHQAVLTLAKGEF